MKLKLFLLTALCTVGFMLPSLSFAAPSNLSIRLGQPKTPTNQNNLKLTFVALEIGGTENISVDCYKKTPSDADFVLFESKSLIPGGNTDYCSITSSILNTNGQYSFKALANNSVVSNIVVVDYNTSGPSTPEAYSKEKINSCDYKIKFKTANDGKTARVELYRSEDSNISVNSSGRVASLVIGPNTEGEFINSVPTCGKDYFYVIRAIDSSENVSGTTGDSSVKIVNVSSSSTTPTQGALIAGDGSQVAGGAATGTEADTTAAPVDQTSSESATPEVLGTETTKFNFAKWISLGLIGLAIFFFLNSRKRAK